MKCPGRINPMWRIQYCSRWRIRLTCSRVPLTVLPQFQRCSCEMFVATKCTFAASGNHTFSTAGVHFAATIFILQPLKTQNTSAATKSTLQRLKLSSVFAAFFQTRTRHAAGKATCVVKTQSLFSCSCRHLSPQKEKAACFVC